MIHYQIVTTSEEKQKWKNDFQDFFRTVYERDLSDESWEHQFLHSPYENSALFLAFDSDNIIGSALMIPQKLSTIGFEGTYYLWTTSAIKKEYRSQGIYAEILKMQREYAKGNKKDFIFAFPNKLAYPVVKLFGGFKDLYKTDLVETSLHMLDLDHIENSLLIDEDFFKWRFEHKDYLFYQLDDKIIISKKFGDTLDVLAIYTEDTLKNIDLNIEIENIPEKIITIETFLKENSKAKTLDKLSGTYFPINQDIDYTSIKLNLLMSDVF